MAPKTFTVHTSLLFDPKQKEFVKNVSLSVDPAKGVVVDVWERDDDGSEDDGESLALEKDDIDLRGKVVMPGFVDAHTHIFLHAYDERSSILQMRDESIIERTVRATNHCRAALLSGYTTYRDLGTEAMETFDANLRDCVNRGLIPGPRLFVTTHAVASSGSYAVRIENRYPLGSSRLTAPQASDPGDGVGGVRAAVRRRVGDGADVIKFYAEYRRKALRFPVSLTNPKLGPDAQFLPNFGEASPPVPLFQQDEMDAIVAEAKLAELPVAAHATKPKAALMAARAGVTSLEHGFEITDEVMAEMRKNKVIWVPTLAVVEAEAKDRVGEVQERVKKAFDAGNRLAAGGDTGAFNHGFGAREIELLIEAGIPVEDALEACMVGGWEACGGDLCGFRFGWFEKGNRADIIALDSDPRTDKRALRKVSFVMKDGRTWKRNGQAVGMLAVPEWPAEAEDTEDESPDDDAKGSGEDVGEGWTHLDAPAEDVSDSMQIPSPVYKSIHKSK